MANKLRKMRRDENVQKRRNFHVAVRELYRLENDTEKENAVQLEVSDSNLAELHVDESWDKKLNDGVTTLSYI